MRATAGSFARRRKRSLETRFASELEVLVSDLKRVANVDSEARATITMLALLRAR